MRKLNVYSIVFAGVLSALYSPRAVTAQQITIKLVDGRNGRALKNQVVAVWRGEKSVGMPTQTLLTNTNGIAFVPVPDTETSFTAGGESLMDCRMRLKYNWKGDLDDHTTFKEDVYRFSDVLSHGIVAANKCGKAVAQPVAGQLVLFVRPPHWWERVLWE
jgi:hypothetical protein